jgi:hypothetical protein
MNRRIAAAARVTLAALVAVATVGAALPVCDHCPRASASSQPVPGRGLHNSLGVATDPPVALPDPIVSGGTASQPGARRAPSDDRDNTTPTAWHVRAGQTAQQVTDTINKGYRLVDIDVDTTWPSYRFTSAYVANSGSYQKSWWWYYDVDGTALSNALSSNNARLIALKAHDVGAGQIRFTAVMISNTGRDATAWWWYYDVTPAEIAALLDDNSARLTQIHAYETLGQTRYAVVMVDNTGANNRAWWWYYDVSPAPVSNAIQTNDARLIDMDINPETGRLDVIMVSCASGCPYWWWYVGVTEDQLLHVASQNGARVIDVTGYPGCGGTCYNLLLINNSNAITTRVGEMLRSGTDGTKGLYLEEVGGAVLANLMNDYQFEPASTLKVGVHLHTIQQIRDDPAVYPSTLIPRYAKVVPPNSCPSNTVVGTESIFDADRAMMRVSDNATTRELVDYFGQANVNATMASIGMSDSSINHVFGCGGPIPNQTTLDDLATLYRGVVNGSLLDGYDRALFYLQMAGTHQFNQEGYDWTHLVDTDIPAMVAEEAPSGMPVALRDAYEDDIFLAYKAGGYKICTSTGCATYLDHISIFGYGRIPFCDAGGPRDYVFGLFIANATSDDDSEATFDATRAELLREQIRAGLASCFHRTYLPLTLK